MKNNKLPMTIFQRGKGINLSKGFIISLILLILTILTLGYLVNSKKVESAVRNDYSGLASYPVQLDGSSLVIVKVSSPPQPEKGEVKQQETRNSFQPIMPVKGKIVHEFGWRKEKQKDFEEWRYLPGLDWQVEGAQEVKAILPGKVEAVEKRNDLGYTIIISHQQDLKSLYGYCTKVRVKPGEDIEQGQLIAQIQNKLHFRMLRNSQPFDPKEYFVN